MTLREVLVGTPKFAEVGPSSPLGSASLSLWYSGEFSLALDWGIWFSSVFVAPHHWEDRLRCSECKVRLAADSGEKSPLSCVIWNIKNLKMSEAICRWKKWLWISAARSHSSLWQQLMSYLSTPVLFQTACVSQYEHKDLAEFLEGLWASLRREVCCGIYTKSVLFKKFLKSKVMRYLCHCRCFRQRVRKSSLLLLLLSPHLLPVCHGLSSSLTLRTLSVPSLILSSEVISFADRKWMNVVVNKT